jgi:hypothetical protein
LERLPPALTIPPVSIGDPVSHFANKELIGADAEGGDPGIPHFFWYVLYSGYCCSWLGKPDEALEHYRVADYMLEEGVVNPALSILRHNVGVASGSTRSPAATEDQVYSFFLEGPAPQRDGLPHLVSGFPESNLSSLVADIKPGFHGENIRAQNHPEDRAHVMVMSTGRCGTMALHHLFNGTNLESYHSYWFMSRFTNKYEMMARLHANNFDKTRALAVWASTRAAEWLGEKPMIGLNHTDTIYAPVFAAIHPKSKFVYLRRDPEKVFKSFYTKNQYLDGAGCLVPFTYSLEDEFRFSPVDISEKDGIHYHIEYTERFCRAFGNIMGDRWIEISSDKLFAQDPDEIEKLLEFVGSDVSLEDAVEHFKTPVNVKAHKVCRS